MANNTNGAARNSNVADLIGSRGRDRRSDERSSSSTSKEDKVPTTIWCNPHVPVPGYDEPIQLPFGLAIDTMNYLEERGSTEWVATVKARNAALDALKGYLLETLEPGEEIVLDIPFVFRRVEEKAEPTAEQTELVEAVKSVDFSAFARKVNRSA